MEHVDDGESDARCPLGMISVPADRRSGSVSPSNLPRTKHEGIKSSATEPHLSSAHTEQHSNVRYVLFYFFMALSTTVL